MIYSHVFGNQDVFNSVLHFIVLFLLTAESSVNEKHVFAQLTLVITLMTIPLLCLTKILIFFII